MRAQTIFDAGRGAFAVIFLPCAVFILANQSLGLTAALLAAGLVLTVSERS
jgi:hypothetical protein